MNTTVSQGAAALPWLRSTGFDMTLILGTLLLGTLTAAVVLIQPNLLYPIALINLWLLGYHHVISTYTRLCFDKESFAQSRFLIFGLVPIVVIGTLLVLNLVGIWAIFTVYFYWQWWHYTRQSWGVSRAYRARDRDQKFENGKLDQAIFYALPVAGLLHRSYQDPDIFLGAEIYIAPVPYFVYAIGLAVAVALVLYWVYLRIRAWHQGELAVVHTLYMSSHFVLYSVAYIFIKDISIGWLAINIWHNAQYILFVWLFNSNRFKNGVEPGKKFLSYISQRNRFPLYVGVCLAITAAYYILVIGTLERFFFVSLTSTLVIYQMVNFHHYIVDSVIWKVRKPAIRKNIGIST